VSPPPQPIAEELAKKQREISVAEFFERNKQILGFDSPTRALLTAVKEAVDNALDACEEASVLPDIKVEIKQGSSENEYLMIVEDNGPGIVKKNIGNVFGSLLFGSRFHAVRQSRGQQGIGISATVLYGQLTTGKHAVVTSKIGKGHPAVKVELAIDTKKNAPEIIKTETDSWEKESGTRVEIALTGRYIKGKQSPWEYMRATAIVNPHARFTFIEPNGATHVFERGDDRVPPPSREIKPHPQGTEMGTLLRMAREYQGYKLSAFLTSEFSSIGARTASEILKTAKLDDDVHPKKLSREDGKALLDAFGKVKIMSPPTDCLSPIGELLVKRGLKKETEEVSPEFIVSTTRPAAVQSGHPFAIEVGIVYGGTLPKEEPVKVLRYGNRVPLLFQQGACACTKAVEEIDWRRYGFEQRGGAGLPVGPAIVLVHIASTKIPFTSEAKEAVAEVPEIIKEVKLALQESARLLARHLAKKTKREKTREKFILIAKVLPEIAKKSAKMIGKEPPNLDKVICEIMNVVWMEDKAEYEKMPRLGGAKSAAAPPAPKPAKKGEVSLADFEAPAASNAPAAPAAPIDHYFSKASVAITNYTLKKQKFRLYAVIPKVAVLAEAEPKPDKVHENYLMWELPALGIAQKTDVKFTLANVEKGDHDECELYVEGINEVYVVGADLWRGHEGLLAKEEDGLKTEA
jgi:DNA topoisomerase VI subunit B